MLRADNVICGTTDTGTTSPLHLSATPVPPGGVDFDVFARATGIGFANGAAVIVSYTIIEFTDSTFATAKSHEKGLGTLTLGGSSGIANATLARTLIQTTATSLNSQPAAQNILPGSGISIVTAANTLVFIGVSSAESIALDPFIDATSTNNLPWQGPLRIIAAGLTAVNVPNVSGTDYYYPFVWAAPMLVKRIILYVQNTYTGQNSNVYARIYACSALGQPGKLLIDFGLVGTSNASLASAASIQSLAHANGFFLLPGSYFINILGIFTAGGSGTPNLNGSYSYVVPPMCGVDTIANFTFGMPPLIQGSATGGVTPAPDTANLTGYTLSASAVAAPNFALKAT